MDNVQLFPARVNGFQTILDRHSLTGAMANVRRLLARSDWEQKLTTVDEDTASNVSLPSLSHSWPGGERRTSHGRSLNRF